jgi:hypothetical protein
MLILTLVGVVGTVVYSYKMSRTRVYPVGIARRRRVTRPVAPLMADNSLAVTESKADVASESVNRWAAWADANDYVVRYKKLGSGLETSKDFADSWKNLEYILVDGFDAASVSVSLQGSSWICPKCDLVQKYEKEARCGRCSYAPDADANITIGPETTKASALQSQLSQHNQALQDLDKRIRELEKESVVKKIAEVAREEEGRQDWVQ